VRVWVEPSFDVATLSRCRLSWTSFVTRTGVEDLWRICEEAEEAEGEGW
jgi:hypothetical protein